MKQRMISGVLGALILIFVLLFGTPIIQIGVSALAVIGVCEVFYVTHIVGKRTLFFISVAASLFMMIAQSSNVDMFGFVVYIYILALFVLYMSDRKKTDLKDIGCAFIITVYVSFMFGHILYVRSMDYGYLLIWLVFVVAFVTDIFAMLGGKMFGKHKLCPNLSPKKTVEGSMCGTVACVMGVVVYCFICKVFCHANPNYLNSMVLGFLASVISQIGDLSASCIKRQYGVKDYGNIMPGHGGVMDRFDSVLFVAPFIYYVVSILPVF